MREIARRIDQLSLWVLVAAAGCSLTITWAAGKIASELHSLSLHTVYAACISGLPREEWAECSPLHPDHDDALLPEPPPAPDAAGDRARARELIELLELHDAGGVLELP